MESHTVIIKLTNEIYSSMEHIKDLKSQLQKEIIELEKICIHDYIAEDNGDCHKSGYYYTCVNCKHFTTKRPLKYRF